MSIPYRDRWPSLDRLWRLRHAPIRTPFGEQMVCVTCSGVYTAGQYRAHRRSEMHRANRGWWRR